MKFFLQNSSAVSFWYLGHQGTKTPSPVKLLNCFALVLFFIIFSSCNSPEKSKAYPDSVNAAKADSANAAAMPDPNKTAKDPVNPHYTENENPDTNNANEFEAMNSETIGELKYGQNEDQLISILGQADEKSKMEYWDGDGLYHCTWFYKTDDVEVGLAGNDSLEMTVDRIRMNENCKFKTSRDVVIGMSYDKVKEAYEDEITEPMTDKTFITAGSIYGGVIFTFQDDKLISVFVGASAE